MKTASITQTKNQLSALIDEVKSGQTILILDRGKPVARLVPASDAAGDEGGVLDRLERDGLVRRALDPSPTPVMDHPPLRLPSRKSALAALRKERKEGR